MRWGLIFSLSVLLVTRAADGCNKEDCETGLSVGVGVASTCATVGGAVCAATGWLTFGLTCAVGLACGVAAGVAEASKEACRACGGGGGGGGVGVIADRLSAQMKELSLTAEHILDQTIKLEGQIQLTQIINLYGRDISNYQKLRGVFKRMSKNAQGLVIRNLDQESFEQTANSAINGAAASSMIIFQMMTGGHPLKRETIFQAVPETCENGAKDFFIKVMMDCYMLESVARAMRGESMSPARALEFKKQLIRVQDQFIKDCGCPEGLVKTSRQSGLQSSLASLARSLPSGHLSSQVTYTGQPVPSLIMDDSTDRQTLKKITLLFSAAPFSPEKVTAAKAIAEKYSMEELVLAEYLATSGLLGDLPLYENHLFCAKTYRVVWHGQCVKEPRRDRLLPLKSGNSNERTPYNCIASCKLKGFLLAGVQYKRECWCGNTPPPSTALTSDSECNKPCPGDLSFACGGSRRMNVYSTGGTLVLSNGQNCETEGKGTVKESGCLDVARSHGYLVTGRIFTGSWDTAPRGCFVKKHPTDNWTLLHFNSGSGSEITRSSIYRTFCNEH